MAKLFDYVMQHGGEVRLKGIDDPPAEFGSILAAFEAAFEHEQFVTRSIDGLMETAATEKDHATQVFLQWFVSEQVEEEATVQEIVDRFKMAGDNGAALMMLDEKMMQRAAPVQA